LKATDDKKVRKQNKMIRLNMFFMAGFNLVVCEFEGNVDPGCLEVNIS